MNSLVKAHVSRVALRHNFELLSKIARGVPLCAMVKANAYGHGLGAVVEALSGAGVAFWGVACAEEALSLLTTGALEPVLVLQPVGLHGAERDAIARADLMIERRIRATVVSQEGLDFFACRAKALGKPAVVHVKIDTGMGRNGCPHQEALELLKKAAGADVALEGAYTHLACADEADLAFAREQVAVFKNLMEEAERAGIAIRLKHIANSAAIFNLSESLMDMARPGLALYGYGGKHIKCSDRLKPSLKVTAPIVLVKNIAKGGSSGYGASFVARRNTRAGLLPLGYADGYSRRLSNAGSMEVCGRQVPVIGRVSMDLTMIDITDAPDARQGSEALVISDVRSAPNSVESLASRLDTIPHEITTSIGSRIGRVLVD